MMQKIVVNQSYETSENEIKSIVNNFESINDYIAKGTRNSIKKKTLENGKIATIKSFKIPNIVNKYVYRFFRKSKAERSYQYAKKLIDLGFKTPYPIAFAENKTPFPNGFFNDSYEVYGANWTKDLLLEFEKKRGYKLEDYFWDLLANGSTDQSVRVISDYRETVGDILKENFTEIWTEWAHSHGVITRNQAHGSPANLIDIYAAVDIPECESFGISDFDIPSLRKDEIHKKNDGDPAILKYASSAAHISGKKYTSSETFTWLTEHFRTSLSQAKVEIDQMLCLPEPFTPAKGFS